jgi:hypothetical protein
MVLVQVGAGPRPALVVLWRRHLAGDPSPAAMGHLLVRKGGGEACLAPTITGFSQTFVNTHRTVRMANSVRLWTPT